MAEVCSQTFGEPEQPMQTTCWSFHFGHAPLPLNRKPSVVALELLCACGSCRETTGQSFPFKLFLANQYLE
jgi:hypothetical protein